MLEFISEIGVNHNGKLEIAKKLIVQSQLAGATYVKFQLRDLNELYNPDFIKNSSNSESANQFIFTQLKKSFISKKNYHKLFKFSKKIGLKVMVTPFDEKSLKICKDSNIDAIKVGSPDFENFFLIEKIIELNKPMYLSTGMTTHNDIKKIISFIKKKNKKKLNITYMHCVSSYPPREDEINLKYLKSLKKLAGYNRIGYSGHERGINPSILSIYFGSTVVERHITLDKKMIGPDHNSSITFQELKDLIKICKYAYKIIQNNKTPLKKFLNKFNLNKNAISIGKNKKIISNNALFNKKILGKSFIYKSNLKKGSKIKISNVRLVSPGKLLGPLDLKKFLNKKIIKNVKKNYYVKMDDFSSVKKINYKINRNWGLVGRLGDFEQFIHEKASLIEIHLTWRELINPKLPKKEFKQELVIHAPEYFNDKLIDFTSNNKKILNNSYEMMENITRLIDKIKNNFYFDEIKGPKLVLHPGGHSESAKDNLSKIDKYRNLMKNINKLKSKNYNLLLENMPPFPWYFGGAYHQHIFTDTNEIISFCKESNTNICYDTSHAKLASNFFKKNFKDFSKKILKYTDYLHISDAKGTDGEGLQIGDGEINFKEFFELAKNNNASFIPEIWNGHLGNGKGFKKALEKLELIAKKISVTHKHK